MAEIEIKQVVKDVSFSWDNVFDVFTDISVHGLASSFGSTPSAGNIASFLKNVRKSVTLNEPPQNAAFRLVLLCFAAAIDELRPTNTELELLDAARETVSKVKIIASESSYFINSDFFSNPVSLPLYQSIRGVFIESLKPLWNDKEPIGGKLDRAFNTSLFKILRLEKDLVDPLMKLLSSPTNKIDMLEQDWVSYRERLGHSFEVKPVFGQEQSHVSLSQVFLPPRAFWTEKHTADTDGRGAKLRTQHVLNLLPDMVEWAKTGDPSRCIRLLRGGPGSGKSSFAKALCAELAKDENIRPIFIELQRLQGGGSLKERTTNLLVEYDEVFRVDPLSKEYLDQNRPVILVFDGLDELVAPNSKGALQIAEDIWDELDELLNNLNTTEVARVKALITGRDPIIQAARSSRRGRRLNPKDEQRIIGLEALSKLPSLVIDEDVDSSSQRENWWNAYARALGLDTNLPPIYSIEKLYSLTSEPLLCYLIALSGKAEESRSVYVDNINDVYEKLIEDVWNRVWGDLPFTGKSVSSTQKSELRRLGPVGVFKNKDDFETILEFVAIAAWRGGESRTATLEEFEKAIRHSEVEDIWEEFQDSFSDRNSEDSFSTLALTFFFRQQDLANRGFEFTHKSFGEYLAARGIVRFLRGNISKFVALRSTSGLEDWLKLTGAVPLTYEILSFLKGEFSRYEDSVLLELQDGLTKVMRLVLSDGMPIRIGADDTWRVSEFRQSNAEGALFAALSAVSNARAVKGTSTYLPKLFSGFGLTKFLNRLNVLLPSSVYKKCLSGLDFSSETKVSTERRVYDENDKFECSTLKHCDLSYSDFSNKSLALGEIVETTLIKTKFQNASFASSFIASSDFINCDLNNVSFLHARLRNVRFVQDELPNVSFCFAHLRRCDFSDVDCAGVDFKGAKVTKCDFSGANLTKAKNLTITQLKKSSGDVNTKLPKGLRRPESWD